MRPTMYFFLLLTLATLALGEYPRLKYRGPPPFPKPPPFQQVQKKWQHPPPRPPIRSQRPGPIPVHMPNHHKIPMGMAASINRPVAVPVRNFWKNTQTTFRTPVEKITHNHVQNHVQNYAQKHFVENHAQNYAQQHVHNHVQNHPQLQNHVQNHVQPHIQAHYMTSAPVLPKKVFQSSPAILAQEYDFQVQSNSIPTPIKTIKQIGEKGPIHTIPAPNLSPADRPLVVEEVKPKVQRQPLITEEVKTHFQRQPEVATYVQIQKSHQYQVTEAPEIHKQTLYKNYLETAYQPQIQIQPQNLQQQNLGPEELYHLINAYSQQPAASVGGDTQDYLQQFPTLLTQQNYVDQIPQEHVATDREDRKDLLKKELSSSLVTAAYNLEPEASESIIQSQYVQNYFDTRERNTANNVEPDAKPSEKNNTIVPEGYYVSLPNKEAAEKLATLQAAGKLNSNLMKGEIPVSIYVPEEGEESREDAANQSEEEEEPSYDDYPQDDLIPEEMSQSQEDSFGYRLKPKK